MGDEWKEVVAEWIGESCFTGKNQSGGSVQIGSFENRPGIGPMEMLLLGVAGCTGMDIVSILGKKRQKLQDLKVRVRGKRSDEHPKVYKEIELIYELWGENLDPKGVEQAIQLSEEKYCTVSLMLKPVAEIRSSYKIFGQDELES